MLGFLILLAIVIFFVALIILIVFLIQGAPYVASESEDIKEMLKAAKVRKGEKAVDLGSGNGVIVMAMARAGLEAHGYEINPRLVWLSRRAIKRAGLEKQACIHWESLWKADLSKFDVVTVYGIPHIMGQLEKKLKKELKPGARVVSNYFTFPHWKASYEHDRVRVYIKTQPFDKLRAMGRKN